MLLLEPVFVLIKLSHFFYLFVFLSGLLPYLCYLFSESLFDEHFSFATRHRWLFLLLLFVSIILTYYIIITPYPRSSYWIFALFFVFQALLAFISIWKNWNNDLIESRLFLRKLFIICIAIYIFLNIVFYTENNSLNNWNSLSQAIYFMFFMSFTFSYFWERTI